MQTVQDVLCTREDQTGLALSPGYQESCVCCLMLAFHMATCALCQVISRLQPHFSWIFPLRFRSNPDTVLPVWQFTLPSCVAVLHHENYGSAIKALAKRMLKYCRTSQCPQTFAGNLPVYAIMHAQFLPATCHPNAAALKQYPSDMQTWPLLLQQYRCSVCML